MGADDNFGVESQSYVLGVLLYRGLCQVYWRAGWVSETDQH